MSQLGSRPLDESASEYRQALAGEGVFWDNFVAGRLLGGEIPGSLDWRVSLSQFRFKHGWRPFCLGPHGINSRMKEIRYVLEAATARPGARILDLGCGAGWLSLELARLGAHVTALDISPTNLALGRHMAETNSRNFPFLYQRFVGLPCRLEDFGSVEYSYADLNTVDLPLAEYDAVVVWDSLHHVAALERLLEQVRRSLKPQGAFVGVDHSFASLSTEVFNDAVAPWLRNFSSWIGAAEPEWFFDAVDAAGRQYDWGVLSLDYDTTPVPEFSRFIEDLREELLEVVRSNSQDVSPDAGPASASIAPASVDPEESPFEDVSAERLVQVLREEFHAEQFRSICPFVQPERYIPHYRSEKERIFQHYLAASLIEFGDHAISEGQADGQWFLFNLTPQRPTGNLSTGVPGAARTPAERYKEIANERQEYINHLEAELQRKQAALSTLEQQVKQYEQELIAARKPKLPWKRERET